MKRTLLALALAFFATAALPQGAPYPANTYLANPKPTTWSPVAVTMLPVAAAPTVTGCGVAAALSGQSMLGIAYTGQFTVGTGASTCTFVITLPITASVDWYCSGTDISAVLAAVQSNVTLSKTSATLIVGSTVTTGDLVTFTCHD